MRPVVCVIFLLVSISGSIGQDLVKPEDLHYHTDIEQQAFQHYLEQGNPDYMALFMAVDHEVTPRDLQVSLEKFESVVQGIDMDRLQKKKPEIRINQIYKKVHDGFLSEYHEQNYFTHIFQDGKYNCVSGTALYGMVFDHLEIPFIVRERPTHVFLEAYPGSANVMVETTAPSRGYYMYDDAFKRQFVKNLASNKIISQAKFEEKSLDDLFKEYYFNDETIDLKELVGIQYMNDAIYRMDDSDYLGAFRQLEKAYIFYPSEKCIFMMLMNGIRLLNEGNYYEDESMLKLLVKLERYAEFGVSENMVVGEFERIKREVLIENNDELRFQKYYEFLSGHLINDEALNDIHYLYHFERGRLNYNQGRYREALPFFEELCTRNPNNLESQGILVSTLLKIAGSESDSRIAAEFLELNSIKFPSLLENALFSGMLANSYLLEYSINYEFRKPVDGDAWKDKFEALVSERKEISINHNLVGEAYSHAAVYYFRKGMKKKSLEYLNAGLAISPNNYELLKRKQLIR